MENILLDFTGLDKCPQFAFNKFMLSDRPNQWCEDWGAPALVTHHELCVTRSEDKSYVLEGLKIWPFTHSFFSPQSFSIFTFTYLFGPRLVNDFRSLSIYSDSFPSKLSRSAINSLWIDGRFISSLYLLNSCNNCKVFPCIFRNWDLSFPAILLSAGPKEFSNWLTAALHRGSEINFSCFSYFVNFLGIT